MNNEQMKMVVGNALREHNNNTLTMNRKGNFMVRTMGSTHCGTVKDLEVNYHLQVVCKNSLDPRGFLFDQLNVDKYFQERFATSLSCELLAAFSLQELLVQIAGESPECVVLEATLELSPKPFMASMTYRYCPMQDTVVPEEQPRKRSGFRKYGKR